MATVTTIRNSDAGYGYDRLKEVKQFDDSKVGVKGLVDLALTSIPKIFIHPKQTLSDIKSGKDHQNNNNNFVPMIDLSGERSAVVEQVAPACREVGFFHGVQQEVMDRAIIGVKGFHEQAMEVKAQLHGRDKPVSFFCNFDLFRSKGASWRRLDTLQIQLGGPNRANPEQIPEICRKEMVEWSLHRTRVAGLLMELMCEGRGLNPAKLKDATCLEGRISVGHFYPYCPQPDLTFGNAPHTDPVLVTVLLQDHIGGLQVKNDDGWLNVEPVPGALVINVGNLMQIMSNNEYRSSEHRVLANSKMDPRTSIGTFFSPGDRERRYGPFPELISTEKPAIYHDFLLTEYSKKLSTKESGKPMTDCFMIRER